MTLPGGCDTVVVEWGGSVSGGQRQRISLARALRRNDAIVILDEPPTSLDLDSEAKVHEALTRVMAGRTCLLITHDVVAVSEADWVLVLDDGRIVESGTHKAAHRAGRPVPASLPAPVRHEWR